MGCSAMQPPRPGSTLHNPADSMAWPTRTSLPLARGLTSVRTRDPPTHPLPNTHTNTPVPCMRRSMAEYALLPSSAPRRPSVRSWWRIAEARAAPRPEGPASLVPGSRPQTPAAVSDSPCRASALGSDVSRGREARMSASCWAPRLLWAQAPTRGARAWRDCTPSADTRPTPVSHSGLRVLGGGGEGVRAGSEWDSCSFAWEEGGGWACRMHTTQTSIHP